MENLIDYVQVIFIRGGASLIFSAEAWREVKVNEQGHVSLVREIQKISAKGNINVHASFLALLLFSPWIEPGGQLVQKLFLS